MKKRAIVFMAASLFATAVPAMAMSHGMQHDANCAKECERLVKNCDQETDSIQQRISKLKNAIQNNAGSYSPEELTSLKAKLRDAEETLASLLNAGA